MKRKKWIFGVALACIIAGFATGCANKSSTGNSRSDGDTLMLSAIGNIADCNPSPGVYCLNRKDTLGVPPPPTHPDMPVCGTGGFWAGTYDGNVEWIFANNAFLLEHVSGFDIYSYWGGFTSGANGDSLDYGSNNTPVPSSTGWICNQWGVMAGGGISSINGSTASVEKGLPYFISFGSGQEVRLKDSASFVPQGVFICNHPWPYYGNLYGDGFANPLNIEGDHFILKIYGDSYINGDTSKIVIDTLAVYRDGSLHQLKDWHWVCLTKLNTETQTLYFELESTDTGEWGMNTAAYFCMDKLTVVTVDGRKSIAVDKKFAVKNPKKSAEEFGDYLTVGTHAAGEAILYDAHGKVSLTATLKAGSNKLDTKKLPAGKYTMTHHHRVKNFIKK